MPRRRGSRERELDEAATQRQAQAAELLAPYMLDDLDRLTLVRPSSWGSNKWIFRRQDPVAAAGSPRQLFANLIPDAGMRSRYLHGLEGECKMLPVSWDTSARQYRMRQL